MGAAAGSGECRRRVLFPRERSLAIAQEDQGLAGRGDRDKVLVSVCLQDRRLRARRGPCELLPRRADGSQVSTRARKKDVDTASPGVQLEAGIGDRKVGAPIAIEIRGSDRPHVSHRAQFVHVDGLPGVVGFP